ncbi:hypothetical protein ABOM_009143 [Aspergillus bombycis]|uniref:HRQ family protein 2 n=1 Tax=Aspergillus bombycis TaxID=109264 RepID=A0A1F7ZST6_9EURO|nr:hypothetical protein ABOM_009143 [Aspergillus bombycis]OGM42158.1 hypothetical protein ABOM_009143 [Aspergillus bombycis]
MAWYSLFPADLIYLEAWIARLFLILGLITIAPWATLIIFDMALYIWRMLTYELPVIGGRARGRQRPRAPSLNERPNGQRRAFVLASYEATAAENEESNELKRRESRTSDYNKMGLYMIDALATYTEKMPLVLLIPLLGVGIALWKYEPAVPINRTPKPTSHNESQKTYPPIEPLPDFNWETTEPLKFRPFKPKYHLTMALSNLDPSTLIQMDKTYKDRLAIRSSLLQKYPDVVVGVNSETDPRIYAAIRELYVFIVGTYLPTRYPRMFRLTSQPSDDNSKTGTETKTLLESMVTGAKIPLHFNESEPRSRTGRKELETLGTLVDEEFLILLPESSSTHPSNTQGESEKYILEAYTTFFPSGFDTRKKLGLRLASIHTPVPGYKEKLERSMDRFFARVEVGQFVQRVNWSVTTDSELFAAFGGVHGDESEGEKALKRAELDVDSTVLRCERQTLHRLPQSKGLVFAFHTYTYPIQMIKDEGLGEDLAAAIDGLKEGNVPGMHWYKRGPVWGEAVKAFLRS